ncbi:MAG: acyltransferase [Cyclobacteriaceae bacterium]|nr:acyltransferase [Cyclobacteriaceae bacterium]
MRWVFEKIWKMIGWEAIGDVPRALDKYIVIVVPHTSNWDFIIGVLARGVVGFDSKFLGKHSLFKPSFGWVFRKLGGYPVDRTKKGKLVDQVVALYRNHSRFVVSLAPEGTRKSVSEWKTGFYFIALKAGIPIVPVKMDRIHKKVVFYAPYWPSGQIEKDLPELQKILS